MSRKKLAITAISGNEERWVKKWCESMLHVADYIVVNLTQYGDNTEALFREHVPKEKLILVKYPWEDDFSKARNQGLEHLPDDVDYCAYVDLDETFTDDSYVHIMDFLKSNTDGVLLAVNIYNALSQNGLTATLFYPRIWPNKINGKLVEPRPHFESVVHNQLVMPKELEIPVLRTKINIWHEGYALDEKAMAAKHKRSEDLLRKQLETEQDNFFPHLNLAQILRAQGKFEETIEHAKEVLRIIAPEREKGSKRYDHAFLMANDQIATANMGLGKFREAIPYLDDNVNLKQDHLDTLIALGHAYLELGELDKSEFWYKRYLFIRKNYDETKDNTNLILNHLSSSFIVLYNLGVLKAMQNDYKSSYEYFQKSMKEEPNFRDIFIKYIHSKRMANVVGLHEINTEINNYVTENPKKAGLVYDYLGDIALDECNVELAKFNYYQAANLSTDMEDIDKRSKAKWNSIYGVFGEVSSMFFDTSTRKVHTDGFRGKGE